MDKNYKLLHAYIIKWSKKLLILNKLGNKCSMCEETRPWVLSFHHTDPSQKEHDIGPLKTGRLSLLEKEVEKCICVCENCHRKIHNKNKDETRYSKSKKIYLEYKNIYKCEKCNNESLPNYCLDFHHIIPKDKSFEISKAFRYIKDRTFHFKTVEDLQDIVKNEIDKCMVLCGNCHQDIHFDKEKYEKYKNEINNKIGNVNEIQPKLDKQQVLDMYNSGMRQIEIARHFNASKGTICDILKSFGLTRKMVDIKINRDEVMKMHIENPNMTQHEISKHFKVAPSVISRIFTERKNLDNSIS
jgi:hypothetical protein